MTRRFARALARDERGVTVIEFAIIAPVMGLLLLGAFDVGHTLYMRGVLQGVVQKVARDASLEEFDTNALDNRVRAQVGALANNANIKITRRYYRTFSDVAAAKAENWTDTNDNDVCDAGEPYEDANGNSVWDKDGGNGGQGGAKDAVLYTVEVTYPRFFPVYRFVGGSNVTTIEGATVLKNQPYGDQASYGPTKVRNCP